MEKGKMISKLCNEGMTQHEMKKITGYKNNFKIFSEYNYNRLSQINFT
jgi:hypothetical protein